MFLISEGYESDKSSDSSSEQESEKIIKKNPITPVKNIKTPVKKEIKPEVKKEKSGKILKTKGTLVNQLLRRWWYALPKWPPEDFDPR